MFSDKSSFHDLPFTSQSQLNDPQEMSYENIARKGENAGNQHFILFPQCFLPYQRQKSGT